MKKEKIYNKIIRIIREMYEIQTPVIKDVKEILIKTVMHMTENY